MPYEATVHNVFIASPGDVQEERTIAREVIDEWNAVHAEADGVILQAIGWETHSFPEMGDRAQGIINRQILENSDILVAIFWYRLGTATGVAESGTIEEIENHLKKDRPAMIYFSSRDVPRNIDTEQLKAVRRAENNYRDRGLIYTFENPEDFRQKFSRQLGSRMVEYLKSQASTSKPEPVSTSFPASALSRLDPSIASDAIRLLQEAVKSDTREIYRKNFFGGFQISANGRDFINDGERKTQARWKAALDELLSNLFVEALGTSEQIYRVTHAGDVFLEALTEETKTRFINQNEILVNVGFVVTGHPNKPQFNYVVRLPRSIVEQNGIEWNMDYILQDERFNGIAASIAKRDLMAEDFGAPGVSCEGYVTFFLGDPKSLPKIPKQTRDNWRFWKL